MMARMGRLPKKSGPWFFVAATAKETQRWIPSKNDRIVKNRNYHLCKDDVLRAGLLDKTFIE
jgi:hypothetical protein